tara:strand:- start:335 stop:1294 length:960 start_codon:yes stop_codon:yes gene_type:complete
MNYETPFKDALLNKFKEKELSESSIKMYIRNLEKLNDDMPLKNLNFLKDVKLIESKLENYKPNTKRNYIISIVSALATDKSNKSKEKLYNEYFGIMMNKNKELKAEELKGEKNEATEKNWISWEDVESKFKELESKVEAFKKNKEINHHQYQVLLNYMVLALYVFNPPRRNDYQFMNLIKTENPNLSTDFNYLDYDKKQFIFNKFKTSKREGQIKIPISEPLMTAVYTYLKFHPSLKKGKVTASTNVPFLIEQDSTPLNQVNSITRILNSIFGKKIGSSMLRKIYDTSKYGKVLEEMKEDAKAMSHSIGTQQANYIKTN